MPDLILDIRISRGEPWRSIATGVWPAGGKILLTRPTEPLPPRLIAALDRHPDEFEPAIGLGGAAWYGLAYHPQDCGQTERGPRESCGVIVPPGTQSPRDTRRDTPAWLRLSFNIGQYSLAFLAARVSFAAITGQPVLAGAPSFVPSTLPAA